MEVGYRVRNSFIPDIPVFHSSIIIEEIQMALTIEWRDRINTWRNELKRHRYRKLGTLALNGFTTFDHLPVQAAAKRRFKPMPIGTRWGAKWEYGWFKCRVTVPKSAEGKRIALKAGTGGSGESLVFLNGRALGSMLTSSLDGREEIILTRNASAGAKLDVMIETYGRHGWPAINCGPVPPGRVTTPEPPPTQMEMYESSFGIWEEDAYQLWMDVETLFSLRENMDQLSLRVAEIDAGLHDFTTIVDFELPLEDMLKTFRAARKRLAPLMRTKNSATTPTMFAFGHGHLDIAWLWPLAETDRKVARTFSNQVELINEYPGHKFLQSEAYLYWRAKKLYPELYARVKKAVKSGGFVPEGSMWVEPDMNIAGGEALIRQCMHGKQFFKEEFGVDNELLWLPDVFGYSAALPQILRGCGIKYFATAKILWNYHGGDPFPCNIFMWEGIDGTSILAHIFDGYGGPGDPESAMTRWNNRLQKNGVSSLFFCYGHGDGGGGPVRDHVESVLRLADLEGCPKLKTAGPVEFFKDLEKRGVPDVKYVGELYYQCHRGTYTSQARTKKGNRKSELALREAEMWGAAAMSLAGFKYPAERMNDVWRELLLNQFHDILPGSSIARVYEEAEKAFAGVIQQAGKVATNAASKLTRKTNAITVFNSLNWSRKAIVQLPATWRGAYDAAGNLLAVQQTGKHAFVEVAVPSCGWTAISPSSKRGSAGKVVVTAGERTIENELLAVKFNNRGEITSIFDKEAHREHAAGLCNSFKMYKDVPSKCDAWDIDSMYPLTPVKLGEPASFKVLANGPLLAQIQITRKLSNSVMKQVVSLRQGSRRVDFTTAIDWHETHKLLKVAFPVAIHANEAVHEIQFGHLRRPNHISRPYDADRFEVANQKWSALVEEGHGFAVLNDCKYGLNVLGNSINLTLLRAPKAPDMNADQGLQEFTYAFYAWNGSLADSDVVREAYDLNCPVITVNGKAGERSVFNVDAPSIVVEAVKPAEDGSGDIIVRLYETKRTAVRCVLGTTLPVKRAASADMLENVQGNLKVNKGRIALEFRPFEIKTLRLTIE
jgi:alpha-mannosidase